jgi:hypothetical protein
LLTAIGALTLLSLSSCASSPIASPRQLYKEMTPQPDYRINTWGDYAVNAIPAWCASLRQCNADKGVSVDWKCGTNEEEP